MGSNIWTPRWSVCLPSERQYHRPRSRPIPIRIRTYSESSPRDSGRDEGWTRPRSRQKSAFEATEYSPHQSSLLSNSIVEAPNTESDTFQHSSLDTTIATSYPDSLSTPPTSPLTRFSTQRSSVDSLPRTDLLTYDFSKLDYELERAKVLGHGLWSAVYIAEQKQPARASPRGKTLTPPATPQRPQNGASPSVYAVKLPSRQDARSVFQHEARVLSRVQWNACSSQYIVPFCGLDERNEALVFEAVIGGSLDDLISRLKQMTEVSRHLELISVFPGIAYDLISGLNFLHDTGLVHADIKPANILLDISEPVSQPTPIIRARYIDFSAAFFPIPTTQTDNEHLDPPSPSLSTVPAGGGTWDFMAPEQLRIQKDLSTPTRASDVWSLGMTLLTVLAGESPYAALSGTHGAAIGGAALFRLRDAVKAGDPLAWARMDPVPRKRLAACQDFVDCCRLALKKDRENRVTAEAWMAWIESQQMGT